MATYTEIGSIAGTSRSSFAQMLKIDYFPQLEKWIHTGSRIQSLIAPRRGKMGGEKGQWAVATDLPQSAGFAIFEGHKMLNPVGSTHVQPDLIARDLFYRIRLTGKVRRAAKKGKKVAYAAPTAAELALARDQFMLNFSRMLYNGPADILDVIESIADSGGAGADTITVYDANDRRSTAASFFKSGGFYVNKNMEINYVDEASILGNNLNAHAGALTYLATVTAKDDSTPTAVTLTVDSMTGLSGTDPDADDFIVPGASRLDTVAGGAAGVSGADFAAPNGLANLIDGAATLYSHILGLQKTTYDGLQALEHSNSGTQRQFSERHIEYCMTRTRKLTSGVTNALILDDATLREVSAENRGDRRFDPVITKSGHGKLAVIFGSMEAPYEEDWLCKPGLVYGISKKTFGWYEECPLQPLNPKQPMRFRPDYDEDELAAVKSGNLFNGYPAQNFHADDFAFDTTAPTGIS